MQSVSYSGPVKHTQVGRDDWWKLVMFLRQSWQHMYVLPDVHIIWVSIDDKLFSCLNQLSVNSEYQGAHQTPTVRYVALVVSCFVSDYLLLQYHSTESVNSGKVINLPL